MRSVGLLLLMSCASAAPWTRGHELLGVTAGTAIAADCAATQYSIETDPTWRESNPILGARPDPVILWSACGLGLFSVVMVADALPAPLRVTWLMLVTAVEVTMLGHNLDWWYVPVWRWTGR